MIIVAVMIVFLMRILGIKPRKSLKFKSTLIEELAAKKILFKKIAMTQSF